MDKVAYKQKLLAQVQKKIEEEKGIRPSLNQAITLVCEAYLASLQLNQKQLELIQKASNASKKSPLQILSAACEWSAKFYGSKYQREVQKNDTRAGSAYVRIDHFVRRVMKKNDLASRSEEKVFINQTYLMKHQGANRDAIKGYLNEQASMLEKHHKKHRLSKDHNAKVARFGVKK